MSTKGSSEMSVQTVNNRSSFKTIELAYIAMFAALTAVCSWIAIPTTVPFTMQTFAVFITMLMLGGRRGFFAVLTYVLLGAAGVPVFAEFTGGLGVLFGMTGGYILGTTALPHCLADSKAIRSNLSTF